MIPFKICSHTRGGKKREKKKSKRKKKGIPFGQNLLGSIRWYKMRISSHVRDEIHIIRGFSLMVISWFILSGQIAAEPLMGSPWAKRLWLAVKTNSDLFRYNSFATLSPLVATFSVLGLPTGYTLYLAQSIESVLERALCSQVGSVWKGIFFFFF